MSITDISRTLLHCDSPLHGAHNTMEDDMASKRVREKEFAKIRAEFDWSNDDWAMMWLPWIRAAAIQAAGEQANVESFMGACAKDGTAEELLDGLGRTKVHLESLTKLIDRALLRTHAALKQFGYSPDGTRAH